VSFSPAEGANGAPLNPLTGFEGSLQGGERERLREEREGKRKKGKGRKGRETSL